MGNQHPVGWMAQEEFRKTESAKKELATIFFFFLKLKKAEMPPCRKTH